MLQTGHAQYAHDRYGLIAASNVIAVEFATIAAANNYWRALRTILPHERGREHSRMSCAVRASTSGRKAPIFVANSPASTIAASTGVTSGGPTAMNPAGSG